MAFEPDETTQHLLDLLEPLGDVEARRMFGACGLFCAGRMFALVSAERVYLRTDPITAAEYADADAFSFVRAGRTVVTKYRELPADVLEDSQLACDWALRAIASGD